MASPEPWGLAGAFFHHRHARLARDFPAGSERYVVDAEGYVAMLVNGEMVMQDGRPTGALPGRVLRGG